MHPYYLAIEIGASSGRHILGHVEEGKLFFEQTHRFDNKQIHRNGHDCWDMDNLWNGIVDGLKACKALGKIPSTVGIDTTKELAMAGFRAADVDLVILQLLTYATSYNMLPAVRDLDVPVVLVNLQKTGSRL